MLLPTELLWNNKSNALALDSNAWQRSSLTGRKPNYIRR